MERAIIPSFTFYNDTMALRDQPYMPLFVQDFLTDEKLNECSASATGVYIKIMCLMHKSEQYGVILVRQKDKQTDDQIKNFALKFAKLLPFSFDVIHTALIELLDEKVLAIDGDVLGQKRMIEDGKLSVTRSKSGREGGLITQANINFAKATDQAKDRANTEYEYDSEIETDVLRDLKESFAAFWDLYDKKVGEKGKLLKKWAAVKPADRIAIMEYIPKYKLAQPNKKYRKHPATFLSGKSWLDELIYDKPTNNGAHQQQPSKSNAKNAGLNKLVGQLKEDIRARGTSDTGS